MYIRNTAESRATTQKTITVDNILEQSEQDLADAQYEQSAAKYALLGGEIGAASSVFGGLGTFFSSFKTPGGGS